MFVVDDANGTVRGEREGQLAECVVTFLNRHPGESYCNLCICQTCALENESEVALVTATLGLSPDYDQAIGLCSRCGNTKKLATKAV